MFGKTTFILKMIVVWGLVTTSLVESSRQKKDVHHMIFLNESKRPPDSHRYRNHKYNDRYKENKPVSSRKKPVEKQPKKEPTFLEEVVEESSPGEYFRPKPKSKRHQHKHPKYSGHNHKRHNNQIHQQSHKKYQTNNRHYPKNPGSYKVKESHKFPSDTWIPMSSKEFFAEQPQYLRGGNGLNRNPPEHFQSVPLEITTSLPLQSGNSYQYQNTIYPPLSSLFNQILNQKPDENSSQPPYIPSEEPYKPFDYSILEQSPPNLNPSDKYEEGEVAASNVVHAKHSGGKNGNPFSIVVENSRENFEIKKEVDKEKKIEGNVGKSEKANTKGKRPRGSSRYRTRSKN